MIKEKTFKEKYINDAEKTKIENKDKIVLTNDTFAIAELLNELNIFAKRNL